VLFLQFRYFHQIFNFLIFDLSGLSLLIFTTSLEIYPINKIGRISEVKINDLAALLEKLIDKVHFVLYFVFVVFLKEILLEHKLQSEKIVRD